jgi:hypothetical protein
MQALGDARTEMPSTADFLWMGASQQEHKNKDECRSHERKIRRLRYCIGNQEVFEHGRPPLNHQAMSHPWWGIGP